MKKKIQFSSTGILAEDVNTEYGHHEGWCEIPHVVSCFAQHYSAAVGVIYSIPLSLHKWGGYCSLEDIVGQRDSSPKHLKHFQWDSDLENVLAIIGIEYPCSLATSGQQLFNNMLCIVLENKFITDCNMQTWGSRTSMYRWQRNVWPLIMISTYTLTLHVGYWFFSCMFAEPLLHQISCCRQWNESLNLFHLRIGCKLGPLPSNWDAGDIIANSQYSDTWSIECMQQHDGHILLVANGYRSTCQ